ncbi:hypothetical protein AYO20_02911 [Fonsecaea nubica]|uniref:PWI domain-containing protein n=1 Tax=Fonsecaea nubica TaxID=856822 RepID=A0A178D8Q1_9EURO|nr:hypothetical protein AYO20_02911 [Fonsecaea nubica]OAL37734.1 hypothetical protein AYO20_02911 [Fonsecaea nubica]
MATAVDQKLLRQTKFPPEFNQKVDMKKVNVEVMKKWIAGKISEILGSEDDVVIELCFNLLEGSRFPDIKALQISLTGFLDKDTPKFCKELWNLCLSAQSNAQGVPKELLEAKKLELIQEKRPWRLKTKGTTNKLKSGILIRFDSVSGPSAVVVAVVLADEVDEDLTRDLRDTRGLPHVAEDLHIEALRPAGRPTFMFLGIEVSLSFPVSLTFLTTFSSCWPICVQVKLEIQNQNQVQVQVEVGTILTEPFTSTQKRTQFKEQESDQVTPAEGLRQVEKTFGKTTASKPFSFKPQSKSEPQTAAIPPRTLLFIVPVKVKITRQTEELQKGRADILKGRNARDVRRLSRSPDEYDSRRRGSRSRSRSRRPHHKRRLSLQRYEPAARRRRNTSSDESSPEAKRRKRDASDDEVMRDTPGKQSVDRHGDGDSE